MKDDDNEAVLEAHQRLEAVHRKSFVADLQGAPPPSLLQWKPPTSNCLMKHERKNTTKKDSFGKIVHRKNKAQYLKYSFKVKMIRKLRYPAI